MTDEMPSRLTSLRFRFTIDVEVSVDDLPTALIDRQEEVQEFADLPPEQFRQYLELQRTLLHALIKRPEILAELVLPDAAEAASENLEEIWNAEDSPKDHEILAPIIQNLPPYERVELQAAIRRGMFSDLMELALYEAIVAEVTDMVVDMLPED